jgi:hypothetical protein
MTVTTQRLKELRSRVDAVEAERMEWARKVIDGLVADGVSRDRICIDMTDDKTGMAIGVDRALVAASEIVVNGRGIRFEPK